MARSAAAMIAALDIGGTKIAAGLVDRNGRVLSSAECPTRAERGFDDGFHRMSAMVRDLHSPEPLEGIGIGCTGPVDPFSGTIGDAELLRGWWGAPIVERLSREFDVPAIMENDGDAAALAQSMWGQGRDAECLVCITVGTGIGGGIVRNGELYRGAGGAHPEIGHIAVDVTGGPQCYCGLHGCWESMVSGPAIEALYAAGEEHVSAAEICRRARAGEARAMTTIERVTRSLAIGLISVVNAFCPDTVLLGGGVMRDADLFLRGVRDLIGLFVTQVPANRLRIEAMDVREQAGLQGAAAAWHYRHRRTT